MTGVLYAIPTPLGGAPGDALPAPALATVRTLRHFVVENARTARTFLKQAEMPCALQDLQIAPIDAGFANALERLAAGDSIGLLSEAGCPAIADPGAALVAAAQEAGLRVAPLVGPSSIVLALMASGLEGQRFAFHGYLPREAQARSRSIRELEQRSRREHATQIFIETPYRNDVLIEALLASCAPSTLLCVAADLTLPAESVRTRRIAQWRQSRQPLGRRPAVFLLLSG